MTVIVVGGGPAGMLAAAEAAQAGARVLLLEQNEKLGKKLYITGKGRCNVTNACDRDGFFAAVVHNPRFLYSAFAAFDNRDLMALLERLGVPLKTERGGRVFPVSDKSSDILRAMERHVRQSGAEVRLHTRVTGLETEGGALRAVRTERETIPCDAAILATGGRSYPQTGSTGDGYRFARETGHAVEAARGALVPLVTREAWPETLSGLTLRNVTLSAFRGDRRLHASEPGELLFTHFGLSGPMALSASAHLGEVLPGRYTVCLDLKPALDAQRLDARVLSDFARYRNRDFGNALGDLLPQKMISPVIAACGIDPRKKVNAVTRAEREALVRTLKCLCIPLAGLRPISEAIVTRGGVDVREISPKTMESRRVPRLYFAGEELDLDAYTGGYNLQIAFSTAQAAARAF